MREQRKYYTIIGVSVCVFVILAVTEVIDRWQHAFDVYVDLDSRRSQLLAPEETLSRFERLRARRDSLVAAVLMHSGGFEQSQTGVFEFITAAAKQTGVTVRTLEPARKGADVGVDVNAVRFNVLLTDRFHTLGRFIYMIETGPLAMRVSKITMKLRKPDGMHLDAIVEGTAYLFAGDHGP